MSDNRCKNERECTQEPWCRINGECHRAAAPLAAPLVAPGWKLVPLAPTADMVRAGNARYKCGLLVVQRTYADMLAATPPAPLQGQSAAPYADSEGYSLAMRVMQSDLYPKLDAVERAECDELIRRGQSVQGQSAALPSDDPREATGVEAVDRVMELVLTLPPRGMRDLRNSYLAEIAGIVRALARLPLPAPAGVEGGEKQDSVHPAVNDSPMASPAPLQEPCALDRPELPVRPT